MLEAHKHAASRLRTQPCTGPANSDSLRASPSGVTPNTTNYSAGSVGVVLIEPDGSLGPRTGILHNPAAVLFDFRFDQLAKMRSKTLVGTFLVRPISREYAAKSAARIAARRRVAVSRRGNLRGQGRHAASLRRAPHTEGW